MLDVIRSNAQSLVIKIAFAIIIIVFCFWGVGNFTGGPVTEVISVNGQSIGLQELNQKIAEIEERLKRQRPNLTMDDLKKLGIKRLAAQELILDTLLMQEADRLGLTVTPLELRQAIESIPAFHDKQGKFDPELYTSRLNGQRGETPGSFEKRVSRDLLRYKLQAVVTAGSGVSEQEAKNVFMFSNEHRVLEYILFPRDQFVEGTAPTAEAVRAWYDGNQETFKTPATADVSFLMIGADTLAAAFPPSETAVTEYYKAHQDRFALPEQVRARHILILTPQDTAKGSEEEKKAMQAEKIINDIHKRLLAGEDFAKLAQEFSEDPGSAALGGELGWFDRERMVPEFSQAAFALKPGEISAPVKTQYGYHIVQTEEKRPASVRPLEEVHDEIFHQLGSEEAAGKLQDTLDQILLAVMGGKNLTEAGAPYKLTPQNPGPLTSAELQAQLGIKPEEAAVLLASPAGTTRDTPFVTREGYILPHINAIKPEGVRPFDEVKADIEGRLKAENQVSKAKEAAQAALKKVTSEGSIPGTSIVTSQPLNRNSYIPELGDTPDMFRAAFAADKGTWLSVPYTVENGAVLVRVKEVLPADETFWNQVKDQFIKTLSNTRKQETFNAFIGDLQTKAKVLLKNEKILED